MIEKELEENLNKAFKYALEQNHEFVTVEHLLLSLLDNKDALKLLEECNVNIDSMRLELEEFIGSTSPKIEESQQKEIQPT